MTRFACLAPALVLLSVVAIAEGSPPAPTPEPLAIGDTWMLDSAVLGETRRINVYAPPGALELAEFGLDDDRLPVLYMPDGGVAEDFLHVAGLVQVGAMNGTMRPFLLVGIENTERRRDLTGPTDEPEDLKIAPRVGRSAEFRSFLRDELMPFIDARYPTSGQTAIVGESLAGLFAVECFLLEPGLFDTVIAIDPSLWWNGGDLVSRAGALLRARPWRLSTTVWLATSDEAGIAEPVAALAESLAAYAGGADSPGLHWTYRPLPDERHLAIYQPAALRAFREVLGGR
jgi:uncharacterized protein